jgi:hypothetical protein
MRNRRSALWALGLAGATYAWRNRDRLMQQFNQFNQSRQSRTPQQLPDYGGSRGQNAPEQRDDWQTRERQFGGSDV